MGQVKPRDLRPAMKGQGDTLQHKGWKESAASNATQNWKTIKKVKSEGRGAPTLPILRTKTWLHKEKRVGGQKKKRRGDRQHLSSKYTTASSGGSRGW